MEIDVLDVEEKIMDTEWRFEVKMRLIGWSERIQWKGSKGGGLISGIITLLFIIVIIIMKGCGDDGRRMTGCS